MSATDREMLESEFSDAYKADVGSRPRFSLEFLSDSELDARITEHYAEANADATIPKGGVGWSFEGEAEFFDEYNDYGGSMFGMTYGEAPCGSEDY